MSDKHIIWSNENLDYEDWREELEAQFFDFTDSERRQLMHELNRMYLDDERDSLNIKLNAPILVIGDLGRMNGRTTGYREFESGNIADCLNCTADFYTFYVDNAGDMRCDATHEDGVDYYLYRVYKVFATDEQKDALKEKIYNGTATRADIEAVTLGIGERIARVYGWEIAKPSLDVQIQRNTSSEGLAMEHGPGTIEHSQFL